MMRKNVKRAPPSTKGGINSCTMYRSRTSDLTALLYHSPVYRPSQPLLTIALALAALAGLGGAAVGAAGVPDRLDPVPRAPPPPPGRIEKRRGGEEGRISGGAGPLKKKKKKIAPIKARK